MNTRRKKAQDHEVRFLVDHMLGALARNLRMLGFDSEYAPHGDLGDLMDRALGERRWLLTKRALPKRLPEGLTAIQISSDSPHEQVVQVLGDLAPPVDPARWFTRCLRCNATLERLDLEEAAELVPEYVARTHRDFRRCPSCARVFWPGTHSLRMRGTLKAWLEQAGRMSDGSDPRSH